jgi:hypothetical protein
VARFLIIILEVLDMPAQEDLAEAIAQEVTPSVTITGMDTVLAVMVSLAGKPVTSKDQPDQFHKEAILTKNLTD